MPVLPATPTFPVLRTSNATIAVLIKFRNLMSEESEALTSPCGLSIDAGLISFALILGDRAGDGVVQASVQLAKVVGADRCVQFHRQFGDGLTDIAIVVHDLRHREPLKQEVMSVLDRARADLGARNLAEA